RMAAAPKLVPVRAVDLRTIENRTEVLVALDQAVRFEVSRPEATTSVLTLHGVALPDRLERNLDASSLGGPVTMLSSYRVPGGSAEISKKNIIVADDVKGTVTIKLRNVPWDQALDIVLKSKGLGREDIGNIIRVAPIETLRAEQKSAAEAYRNRQAAEPLKVRLIPVNYARAEQLTAQLKDALTERGTVSVDSRTNTLIVKDVQEALLRAEGIIRNLDTQTPEVLIEARIVEAAT